MECYNQFKSYINAIIVKYKRKCNQWQKLKIITFTLISFVVVCLVSSKLIKFNLQNVSKTKSYSERRTKNSAIITKLSWIIPKFVFHQIKVDYLTMETIFLTLYPRINVIYNLLNYSS